MLTRWIELCDSEITVALEGKCLHFASLIFIQLLQACGILLGLNKEWFCHNILLMNISIHCVHLFLSMLNVKEIYIYMHFLWWRIKTGYYYLSVCCGFTEMFFHFLHTHMTSLSYTRMLSHTHFIYMYIGSCPAAICLILFCFWPILLICFSLNLHFLKGRLFCVVLGFCLFVWAVRRWVL